MTDIPQDNLAEALKAFRDIYTASGITAKQLHDAMKAGSTTDDAEADTRRHISRVSVLLLTAAANLLHRCAKHDSSKLEPPEVEAFARVTCQLKSSTYGSAEYQGFLKELGPALEHHYALNRHHPEHFPDGIRDMNLLDLLEMLCDWKAASERHENGSITRSLALNAPRFRIPPELQKILVSTASALGWVDAPLSKESANGRKT